MPTAAGQEAVVPSAEDFDFNSLKLPSLQALYRPW
jgi:hypothetical protein